MNHPRDPYGPPGPGGPNGPGPDDPYAFLGDGAGGPNGGMSGGNQPTPPQGMPGGSNGVPGGQGAPGGNPPPMGAGPMGGGAAYSQVPEGPTMIFGPGQNPGTEPDPVENMAMDHGYEPGMVPGPAYAAEEPRRSWVGRNAAIVALVIAIMAVAGVGVWAFVSGGGIGGDQQNAAQTSPSNTASRSSEPTDKTTTSAPGDGDKCKPETIARQFGETARLRGCEGEFALIEVPAANQKMALYRWNAGKWEFRAQPGDGTCRENLAEVPSVLTQDFPVCVAPVPTTTSSSPTTTTSTSPTTTTKPSSTRPSTRPSTPRPTTRPTTRPSTPQPTSWPQTTPRPPTSAQPTRPSGRG